MRLSEKAWEEIYEQGRIKVAKDNTAPRKRVGVKSRAEEAMAVLIKAWELPEPVREHRFHPERRWRFDFAWPANLLALEIEGILFGEGGRHQRGQGFANDCLKYVCAQELGWQVVRVPSTWLAGGYGEAMSVVERVIRKRLISP